MPDPVREAVRIVSVTLYPPGAVPIEYPGEDIQQMQLAPFPMVAVKAPGAVGGRLVFVWVPFRVQEDPSSIVLPTSPLV